LARELENLEAHDFTVRLAHRELPDPSTMEPHDVLAFGVHRERRVERGVDARLDG